MIRVRNRKTPGDMAGRLFFTASAGMHVQFRNFDYIC